MKDCGSCTLCCLLTHVSQLDKPVYELCEYCEEGTGCTQYYNRPVACRKFLCVWRVESLPEPLKPDNCHIMFERLPGNTTYVGLVQPGFENKWLSAAIQQFTKEKNEKGSSVIVNVMGHKFIKSPKDIKSKDVIRDLTLSFTNYMKEA